jgi:hypothetical protein
MAVKKSGHFLVCSQCAGQRVVEGCGILSLRPGLAGQLGFNFGLRPVLAGQRGVEFVHSTGFGPELALCGQNRRLRPLKFTLKPDSEPRADNFTLGSGECQVGRAFRRRRIRDVGTGWQQ